MHQSCRDQVSPSLHGAVHVALWGDDGVVPLIDTAGESREVWKGEEGGAGIGARIGGRDVRWDGMGWWGYEVWELLKGAENGIRKRGGGKGAKGGSNIRNAKTRGL